MALPVYQNGDRFLEARDVLTPLVKGGWIPQGEGERLLKVWAKSKEHPLNLVTTLTLADKDGKNLTHDETLSLLSEAWNLSYQRVDLL